MMSPSPAPPLEPRTLRLVTIGAVLAFLLTMAVSLAWRANAWPGAPFAAPATFFGAMGATVALTGPRWRSKSTPVKLLIVTLYALFGAIVVGGLTTFLQ